MKKLSIVIALSLLAMSTASHAWETDSTTDTKLYSLSAKAISDNFNTYNRGVIKNTNSELQAWTSTYYRNFKEHEMIFTTVDDCFTARDFIINDIGAQRILFATMTRVEYGNKPQYIGWKFTNNEETRIECSVKTSPNAKKEYVLTYKTAYKLTAEELAIEDKKWRDQMIESQKNHKENIKSQVSEFLNIIKK